MSTSMMQERNYMSPIALLLWSQAITGKTQICTDDSFMQHIYVYLRTSRWLASHLLGAQDLDLQGRRGERRAAPELFCSEVGASPGDEASGLELYSRVATGKNNLCNIMVELTAKRRFQTYSGFWKRTELTEAEKLLCGTFGTNTCSWRWVRLFIF